MKMRHCYNLVILSGLLVLLSACDISTTNDRVDVTTSTINAFDVEGNVVNEADERIVLQMFLTNATSSGSFHLFWDVESSDPYTIETYISSNSVLDPDPDIDSLFLQMQCGSDGFQFICDQSGITTCGVVYQPDYVLTELRDDNDEIVLDQDGQPIMVPATDINGNFIVDVHRYFLRCADGPATVRLLEITDRVPQPHGFPLVPFSSYFIFKACASEEQSCPELPVLVQFLSSQP